MVVCISCSSDIQDGCQCYHCFDMGPEIISTIENALGHEVNENGTLCEDCFANIMSTAHADSSSVHEEYELPRDQNVCVWCRSSIFRKRTHSLPVRERQFVAERISPRNVPDGSLVCYRCWLRIKQSLPQREVELSPENNAINSNTCVWCLRSLACTRRHALPEGPERNEIISRIAPREIPAQGRVCYACWIAARRIVQRAQNNDEASDSAHHHRDQSCALCSTSLFRRQTHALPRGAERDELAARIFPRELSGHFLCTSCWSINVRQVATAQPDHGNMQHQPTVDLDFRHTTSSSSHCFVPSCSNPERLQVPFYIRKQILKSQKIFVTDNARVCREHKSLYNWEFLDQHEFSNTFTRNEIQSMLNLSVQEYSQHIDFENIHNIDDHIFKFWTGLSKENFNNVYNERRRALTCKSPQTALGVYLIKVRTGESQRRIASLLCLSKSSIARLLNVARIAME